MRITKLAWLLAVASGGCEKNDPLFCQENPGATGCTTTADAALDVGDGGTDGDTQMCVGAGKYTVCLTEPPSVPVSVTGNNAVDTGGTIGCLATQPAEWIAAGQPEACFLVGTSITIDATLTVSGTRPLVLVSTSTITINGTIDVASHRGGSVGPGSPASTCQSFVSAPDNDATGGAGGAGGSFLSQGGAGGDGNNGAANGGVPSAADLSPPEVLRAGCDGQTGGTGNGGNGAGGRGRGGGAIFLAATTSITLGSTAVINASGSGGLKAGRQGGGGGGGTGGMIVLHAPSISGTGAILMANGGGGSSGGEDTGNGNSQDGADPSDPMMPAAGGSAMDNAGDGGDGYANGTAAGLGQPGASSRAGGGGGGGAGYIQANVDPTANASPTPTIIP